MLNFLRRNQPDIEGLWAPLAGILANFLVVGALIVALLTYWEEQHATRLAASLSYVERFNSGETLAARNLVYRSWDGYDFSSLQGDLAPAAVAALVERAILAHEADNPVADEGNSMRAAITNIVAFFDSAQACIDTRVCNSESLLAQIGDYGQDFYYLYRSVIDQEASRTRLTSFALGLRAMVDRRGGCRRHPA